MLHLQKEGEKQQTLRDLEVRQADALQALASGIKSMPKESAKWERTALDVFGLKHWSEVFAEELIADEGRFKASVDSMNAQV